MEFLRDTTKKDLEITTRNREMYDTQSLLAITKTKTQLWWKNAELVHRIDHFPVQNYICSVLKLRGWTRILFHYPLLYRLQVLLWLQIARGQNMKLATP